MVKRVEFILSSYVNSNVGSGYWIRKTIELLENDFSIGYNSFRWKGRRKKYYRLSLFNFLSRVKQIFSRAEVIIIPQFYTALAVGFLSKIFKPKCKLIYGPYIFLNAERDTSFLRFKGLLEKILFSLTRDSLFYVCSKTRKKTLLFKGVKEKNIVLCLSGIELSLFKRSASLEVSKNKKHLKLKNDDFVVGYVNRFSKVKDFDYFLDITEKLRDSSIKFIVIGSRNKLELSNKNIVDVGFISRDRLSEFYSLMDLFVNTSNFESFLLTKAEALSCGIPCIVPNVGAAPEGIEHGKNGYIYNKKDTNALIDIIKKLNNNKTILNTLKSNSRPSAAKNFNWSKNIQPLIKKLKSI